MANQYAKRAWSKRPSRHLSYILAYANYVLDNNDTAAFYAGIALYDNTIHPDVSFNANQRKQLDAILQYYKALNQQRQKDLVTTLYRNYPRYHLIKVRLTLSDQTNLTSKDLDKIAALKEKEGKLPTWEQYVDSLRKKGVPDSIIAQLQTEKLIDEATVTYSDTPEGVNRQLAEVYGTGSLKENIAIDWIDSSAKATSSNYTWNLGYQDGIENPYLHTRVYDSYYFPELYKKREFLLYGMINVYREYLKGKVDSGNYYIARYKLDKKNIYSFFKEVFPIVLENKHRLDALQKEYEP